MDLYIRSPIRLLGVVLTELRNKGQLDLCFLPLCLHGIGDNLRLGSMSWDFLARQAG
jgi:hypothetical protein